MKKNLLLLMLALLLPAFMYGQEQTVSGTVLDTYKMGVPGASIVEKGTTNGTITDFDGNYTLTVSNKNATLVFSFIGYKTQEIPVAGKAKVDVILQENAEQLDEVVVTGYVFIALVYFVPSWKILPTSIPRLIVIAGLPQHGHTLPAFTFAMSTYFTSFRSRFKLSPV